MIIVINSMYIHWATIVVVAQWIKIAREHLGLKDQQTTYDFSIAVTALARHYMESKPGQVHEACMQQSLAVLMQLVLEQTNDNYVRASEILGINRIT